MRKRLAFLLIGAAVALPLAATAQEPDVFAGLDDNKDGFVTKDEVNDENRRLFERLLRNNDKDEDGKLSREEFNAKPPEPTRRPADGGGREADAAEMFRRMDRNGDGKLSKEEAPERIKQFFDRIDANSDGNLEPREFGEAMARLGGGGGPDPRQAEEMFDRWDANKDGKLVAEEVPERGREMFARMLERLDDDGDKSLTKEQFVRAMGGMRPQPGSPDGPRPGGPMPLGRVLDADGNGELSADEIANASKALLTLDKNGDGKLGRDELGPPPPPFGGNAPPTDQIIRRLKEGDKNGDGKIQKEEAPPFVANMFERVDANSDGALDESEIRALVERMRGRFGNRREGERGDSDKPRD
jgi:Ca2+-binding EF-hand superfamily protein